MRSVTVTDSVELVLLNDVIELDIEIEGDVDSGCPGCGPSFSSPGSPPEPAEVYNLLAGFYLPASSVLPGKNGQVFVDLTQLLSEKQTDNAVEKLIMSSEEY